MVGARGVGLVFVFDFVDAAVLPVHDFLLLCACRSLLTCGVFVAVA